MNLGLVSQGGDWMRRREPSLTRGNAGRSLPLHIAMRRQRAISISQMVRHSCALVVRWVLEVGRCWLQAPCLAAKCQSVKNVVERLFSAFQAPDLTYIEYTITGMSVKCSCANLG